MQGIMAAIDFVDFCDLNPKVCVISAEAIRCVICGKNKNTINCYLLRIMSIPSALQRWIKQQKNRLKNKIVKNVW